MNDAYRSVLERRSESSSQWAGTHSSVGFVLLGAISTGTMIRTGQLQVLSESGLTGRRSLWEASVRRLLDDPYVGIGFEEPSAAISPSSDWKTGVGPHNASLHILLNTGIIVGTVSLLALVYGALRSTWPLATSWDSYVAGTLLAILAHIGFESVTLGRLSMTSVFLGLFL